MDNSSGVVIDFYNVLDPLTKFLMASSSPAERKLGYELLHFYKSARCKLHLRRWREHKKWTLSDEDLEEIWEDTLFSICSDCERGKFKEAGSLDAFVRLVCYRRAVELLRRRCKATTSEWKEPEINHDFPGDEKDSILHWTLQNLDKFCPSEHQVLVHIVTQLKKDGVFPSSRKILDLISQTGGWDGKLTLEAVKSVKKRALKKLRQLWERKSKRGARE